MAIHNTQEGIRVAQTSKLKPVNIPALIKDAVNAGLIAGQESARRSPDDVYKATEKRLHAYNIILHRITSNKSKLEDYKTEGIKRVSTSLVRFSKSGSRLSETDIISALIQDTEASIASDEYEIKEMTYALCMIENDHYYAAVYDRYVLGFNDNEIAERLECDTSTIRRNRSRLIRNMSIWLYGAHAI